MSDEWADAWDREYSTRIDQAADWPRPEIPGETLRGEIYVAEVYVPHRPDVLSILIPPSKFFRDGDHVWIDASYEGRKMTSDPISRTSMQLTEVDVTLDMTKDGLLTGFPLKEVAADHYSALLTVRCFRAPIGSPKPETAETGRTWDVVLHDRGDPSADEYYPPLVLKEAELIGGELVLDISKLETSGPYYNATALVQWKPALGIAIFQQHEGFDLLKPGVETTITLNLTADQTSGYFYSGAQDEMTFVGPYTKIRAVDTSRAVDTFESTLKQYHENMIRERRG